MKRIPEDPPLEGRATFAVWIQPILMIYRYKCMSNIAVKLKEYLKE